MAGNTLLAEDAPESELHPPSAVAASTVAATMTNPDFIFTLISDCGAVGLG